MDLETLVLGRYSVRKFVDRQVPKPAIEGILSLAQRTASWCNTQPWELVVTSGAATGRFRDALYARAASGAQAEPDFAFPPRYDGVYRERRKVCGVQLYESLGIGKEDRAAAQRQALENYRFFDAPHVAMLTTDATLGVYGAIDCGLYVANFMLAAQNAGVATIAQASLAAYPDFVRDYFQLPASRLIVCGISFGYADPGHAANGYRTGRTGLDSVVRWET